MFNLFKFLRQRNSEESDVSDRGFLHSRLFFLESWRANESIKEEAIVQRHHLSVILTWLRIIVSTAFLVHFGFIKSTDISHWIIVTVVMCYISFIYGMMIMSGIYKEKIYRYHFFIGTSEVAVLAYFILPSEGNIPISFLFFSCVISALILPFWRTMLVLCLAVAIILSKWMGLTAEIFELFTTNEMHLHKLLSLVASTKDGYTLMTLLLGLCLLTIIVNQLATWSFISDVRAQFRYKQMRQMLAFNGEVIEHLRSGVIIVADDGQILSINRRAEKLLNLKIEEDFIDLIELSSNLAMRYIDWLDNGVVQKETYKHNAGAEAVYINFDLFGKGEQHGNISMLTIESVSDSLQQTHEAKLSALGRLTAGVAHEIRNPLASINSASQLLIESSDEPLHKKLSHMILKNVKRTNQIIDDILGLFNGKKANKDFHSLQKNLQRCIDEFVDVYDNKTYTIAIEGNQEKPLFFLFDIVQFDQIIWNLLQNAVKYAGVENPALTIRYTCSDALRLLYVDVLDNGHGVPKDKVPLIFEPFNTGGQGTGLGLYLVHELCSANSATISYFPRQQIESNVSGSCFRVTTKVYFEKPLKKVGSDLDT